MRTADIDPAVTNEIPAVPARKVESLTTADADLLIAESPDGWRAVWTARLPEGGSDAGTWDKAEVHHTRSLAIASACQEIISWCSGSKLQGGKRHKKAADELQEWATGLLREAIPMGDSITVDTITASGIPSLHTSPIAGLGPILFPVARLHESPRNPRKVISQAGIDRLAESMRTEGFRPYSPIVARLLPDGDGEIARGHRRRLAALQAGLTDVYVILTEMTDEQFDEVLVFDNAGVEDVHPLHEALGWRDWLDRKRGTVKDIAGRIGQSEGYVYKRVKCCELIEAGQRLWLDGVIDESHAVEIARRTLRDQHAAVKFCTPPVFDPEQRVSIKKLREWIKANCNLSLLHAPFSPADDTLPILVDGTLVSAFGGNTGSCMECPNRSGNHPELFDDIAEDDICTNAACYRAKAAAAAARMPAPPRDVPPAVDAPAKPPKANDRKPESAPRKQAEANHPEREPGYVDPEETRRAEQLQSREQREVEDRRIFRENERRETVYVRAMDAILAKLAWPPSEADFRAIFGALVGALNCHEELADKFAIARTTSVRWQDIIAAIPKLAPAKLLKMAIAGILLDMAEEKGCSLDGVLADFAKRYKVDLKKIGKEVDAEIDQRLGLRAQNPPPAQKGDARKDVIGKLPTLAGKSAPAKKAAKPAPAKKAPAKKKGGKK